MIQARVSVAVAPHQVEHILERVRPHHIYWDVSFLASAEVDVSAETEE
jgi:hypothetical protein